MLDIAPEWAGGIDEFVAEANTWLARILPEDRAARPKDEVNPRLVRHYTTLGLIPAPRREGREARYDRSHLLHLLALRRLMADGLSGRVLAGTLSGRSLAELERLAQWGAGEPSDGQAVQASALPAFIHAAPSPALEYVQRLRTAGRVHGVMAEPAASNPWADRAEPQLSRRLFNNPREQSQPRPRPSAQVWRRVSPRPGLELQVGERFRWPKDEHAWAVLLEEFRESLVDVRDQQRAASADDAE